MDAFTRLKKEWYDRLSEEGFTDLESFSDEYAPLSASESSQPKKNYERAQKDLRFEYYQNAQRFLDEHEFSRQRDEIVWRLHSEGLSIRKICKQLKEFGFDKKVSYGAVHACIAKYKEIMMRGF